MPLFSLHRCRCWAVGHWHSRWGWELDEWAVVMLSVFSHVICFLSGIWTEMSHLNMHVIGLTSGCLVQAISPLDGGSVFFLVLVPVYKGKQIPSIAGVHLDILVNCWEQANELCIAKQTALIIPPVCKDAGLDIRLFHVLLRLFCTFQGIQYILQPRSTRGLKSVLHSPGGGWRCV